jgi:hypothetical protein
VEDSGVDEEVANGEVQAVFDQNMSSKNHPNLQAISIELQIMLKEVGGAPR